MSLLTKAFGTMNKKTPGEKMVGALKGGRRSSSLVLPIGPTGNSGLPDDGALGALKKKKKRGAALAAPQNTGGDGGSGDGGDYLG